MYSNYTDAMNERLSELNAEKDMLVRYVENLIDTDKVDTSPLFYLTANVLRTVRCTRHLIYGELEVRGFFEMIYHYHTELELHIDLLRSVITLHNANQPIMAYKKSSNIKDTKNG